jgi:carbon-monoxide dehydrogenase medium subunit
MWQTYIQPRSVEEAVDALAQYGVDARVINGGTDLLFDLERRLRTPRILIDVSRVPGLSYAREDGDYVRIGASVTLSQVLSSQLLRELAYPLVIACSEVGVPQVRNRATVVGNLVTASPSNDAITALWAMGAELKLASARGRRVVPFSDFFRDERQTTMEPDEMVVEVACSKMTNKDRAAFLRMGWDRDDDKAMPNVGVVLEFEDEEISNAWITMGSVAPTVVTANDAEQALVGQWLSDVSIDDAAELSMNAVLRGDGRAEMARDLVGRALRQIRDAKIELPEVELTGPNVEPWAGLIEGTPIVHRLDGAEFVDTTINGVRYTVANANGKRLLELLRDDLSLASGPKCVDGRCGICMVMLDGVPVMSCLVPAPRAHLANIVLAT